MKLFLLIIFGLVTGCCTAQTKNDSLHNRLFTVNELLQDMDSLHGVLKNNHPDLWRHTDSAASETRWQQARKKISRPMKRWDFLRIVTPLVSQYRDGHTNISGFEFDYEEVLGMVNSNAGLFPYKVNLQQNRLYIEEDWTKMLPHIRGGYITHINGKEIGSIIKALMPQLSGDYPANTEATLSRLFSFFLWQYYGWQNDFNIKLVLAGGKKVHARSTGIAINDYLDIQFPKADWSMQLFLPQSLAVIECRNYRNANAAKRFIDSAFALIKEKNIRQVAFDIRRNGGGNSSIGDYLLAYITGKAYTDVVSKTIRDGSLVRNFKAGSWVNNMLLRYREEGIKSGDLYTKNVTARQPDSVRFPQNKFNGTFYLLTGPATYSSAHMTAMAVKCFKLGTLVGQPTGEQNDLTGESFGYQLPNTKLYAYCATATYKAACGEAKQQGVLPDIFVPFSKNDLLEGKDSAIELLKRL